MISLQRAVSDFQLYFYHFKRVCPQTLHMDVKSINLYKNKYFSSRLTVQISRATIVYMIQDLERNFKATNKSPLSPALPAVMTTFMDPFPSIKVY